MTTIDRADQFSARAHPLDSVVWSSLTGPHARFADRNAGVVRYPQDVSPFAAFAPVADERAAVDEARLHDENWANLATLVGRGGAVTLSGPARTVSRLPADWQLTLRLPGVQMIGTAALVSEPDPEAVVLGAEDVPEMLDLVRRTEPGPFLPRTHEMGRYLGIRRGGVLVAMAGERLHPPGWIEVSAVCTDPAFRGQGLAARLIKAVTDGIRDAGAMPFLHLSAANTAAYNLYESLGFVVRQRPEFFFLRLAD
ncbi:MAG TPA: GNAT family N-acetyltransferase [Kineosporiaceae bacterium]|nr:GNAT family N-acetyltransferase [Kineosporiaceae bacterium]